jgi:protease secretion system outer membrane protein
MVTRRALCMTFLGGCLVIPYITAGAQDPDLPPAGTDLLSAYQHAVLNDATYRATRFALEAQRYDLDRTRSMLLPRMALSGSSGKTRTEIESTATTVRDYRSDAYGVTVRQPIYRRSEWVQYQQAKSTVARADALLEKERQTLAIKVSQAYFDALLAQDRLRLVQAQRVAYLGRLQQAERALNLGTGTRTDVYDIRAQHDLYAAMEIEVRNLVEFTLKTLRSITTLPLETLWTLDAGRVTRDPVDDRPVEAWIEEALAASPELERLRHEITVAEREVDRANAGHYPTVDLVASQRKTSNESDVMYGTKTASTAVTLQAELPLYSGGYTVALEKQAQSSLEKTREQLEAATREATLKIRQFYDRLLQNQAKMAAYERAVASAQLALQATEKSIRAGTRTEVDALVSQQQLSNAETQLAQTRYAFVMDYIQLRGVAGRLTEEQLQKVNEWLVPTAPPVADAGSDGMAPAVSVRPAVARPAEPEARLAVMEAYSAVMATHAAASTAEWSSEWSLPAGGAEVVYEDTTDALLSAALQLETRLLSYHRPGTSVRRARAR